VKLVIGTFNVKDYFDSPRNAPVLPSKAREIAKHLTRAQADVVALQEVGSEELVRDALAHVPFGASYTVFFGGADRRGIGNAIVSRLPVEEVEHHTEESLPFPVFREGDPEPFPGRLRLRRPVVRVRLAALGHTLHVLTTHWKSKLPKPLENALGEEQRWEGGVGRAEADLRSLVSRGAEALFVRRLVERHTAGGAEAIVLGDLNDTEDSIPVRILRAEGQPGELFPAADRAPRPARVTTLHRGVPEQIDHLLATRAVHEKLYEVRFFNEALRDHPFDPSADAEPTVDSDHAMVVAEYRTPVPGAPPSGRLPGAPASGRLP